jgi:hypothetical protein
MVSSLAIYMIDGQAGRVKRRVVSAEGA